MSEAQQIITRLGLEPLKPEGGYFTRTWTGKIIPGTAGPCGTAIYFLLTPETFSAFHRLQADELWHFYAGDTVEHWQLQADGSASQCVLGNDIPAGQVPQVHVLAQTWQAACLMQNTPEPRGWSLLGCTMTPGWRDEDFELGARAQLLLLFPAQQTIVKRLTPA